MRTPAACRTDAADAVPETEEELARFRAWLVRRGYAGTTAGLWTARVRAAHEHGIHDPACVEAAFPYLALASRASLRSALRAFDAFRGR
jgi:hypothetical protein